MNSIKNVVALSIIMTKVSKYVQNNKIKIIFSELGNKKPFLLEDNCIHVPKFNILSQKLQSESAIFGLESPKIHNYCKGLLKLTKKILPARKWTPLRPFMQMVSDKKTESDKLVDYVKKKQGYTNFQSIKQETAKEFAIKHSNTIFKNYLITKKMCEKAL